jgi:putative transposase
MRPRQRPDETHSGARLSALKWGKQVKERERLWLDFQWRESVTQPVSHRAPREEQASTRELLSRRWVVERLFGWLARNRRLSKDYERKVQTSETFIQVAMIRLLLARASRGTEPVL